MNNNDIIDSNNILKEKSNSFVDLFKNNNKIYNNKFKYNNLKFQSIKDKNKF
jgi:hypothetical protein